MKTRKPDRQLNAWNNGTKSIQASPSLTAATKLLPLLAPFIFSHSVSAQTSPSPESVSIEALGESPTETTFQALNRVIERHPLRGAFPSTIAFHWDPTWAGSAGFFSRDLRSPEGNPMITLSTRLRPRSYFSIAGHELTHLALAQLNPEFRAEGWFEEGLALLSEYHLTGTLSRTFTEAFLSPTVSLWTSLSFAAGSVRVDHLALLEVLPAYGQALQFALFTERACTAGNFLGAIEATRAQTTGSSVGWWMAAASLSESSPEICRDFDLLFTAFQRARFLPNGIVPTSSTAAVATADAFPTLPPYSAAAVSLPAHVSCASQHAEDFFERNGGAAGRHTCWRVQLAAEPPERERPRASSRRRGR